ncbi:PAS domain S-box protein [Candidatus Accumulibacter vicinus]|uniref:histidine kinase n=1 Tax=Candidatus Accumulibacter vicinus TaxID=2954382 RepID=A0A084Y512_9PROT|nr:PAS domain S-box protein [Candidatus Accumulibacter vicinus]KFB69806.1 MAG: putative sensor histidine kinase pdtaS [Candidatus Accumulibacter vicinus]
MQQSDNTVAESAVDRCESKDPLRRRGDCRWLPGLAGRRGHDRVMWRSLLASLLVVAGLAGAFGWFAWQSRADEIRAILARSRIGLDVVDQSIGASLRQDGRLLLAAYQAYADHGQGISAVAHLLRDGFPLIEQARGYAMHTTDGRVLLDSGYLAGLADPVALDEHLRSATREGVLHVSRPMAETSGRRLVMLSRHFAPHAGRPAVTLTLALAIDHFAPVLSSLLETPTMTVGLFHESGDIVLRLPEPERDDRRNLLLTGSHLSRHLAGGDRYSSHHGVTAADGREQISAAKTLSGDGVDYSPRLVLGVTDLSSEALAGWRSETRHAGLAVATLALFSVLLIWLNYGRALRQERSRLFLQAISDSAGVVVVGVDRAGRVQVFNSEARRLSGLAGKDVIGRSYDELRAAVEGLPMLLPAPGTRPAPEIGGDECESSIVCPDGRQRRIAWTLTGATATSGPEAYAIAFGRDITESRVVWQNLRATERKLSLHLQQSMLGVIEWDADFRIVEWNPAAAGIFGYTRDEALGRQVDLIVPPQAMPVIEPVLAQLRDNSGGAHITNENLSKRGEIILCEWFNTSLTDAAGEVVGVMSLVRDVIAEKHAEERVQSALHDREVLLKEIYHRVKNNLQVVASLLSLQGRGIDDPRLSEVLADSVARVKAMALVHEQLYRSGDLARIALGGYLRSLMDSLDQAVMASRRGIMLRVEADDSRVSIDTAVPCGLLVNELVTNAIKHAFPAGAGGTVVTRFSADADGTLTLEVADNGIGIAEDFDFRRSSSLGLRLVDSLTDQLEGQMSLERAGGTRYRLRFREASQTRSDDSHDG